MNWADSGFNKYRKSTVFLTVLLVFLLQLQDIKFFGVKGGECLGLVVLFFSVKKLNLSEKILFVFFTFFLLITIIKNTSTYFPDVTYDHIFKTPYLINIARWLEYMSCIGIMVFVRLYLFNSDHKENLFSLFLMQNVIFSLLILFFFVIEIQGWSLFDFAYGSNNRLKAFFVEGGPFGLYNAFLIIFSWLFLKDKQKLLAVVVFGLMVVLSRSKAGTTCLLIFFVIEAIVALFRKCSFRLIYKFLLAGFVFFAFCFIGYEMFKPYTQTLFDYEFLIGIVNDNPEHYWINGGRIPGYYITKRMVVENPLTGIGVGNYQLLRNSDLFRMDFSVTKYWDYHGFGGIVDLVVEFGVIGLCCFLIIIYKMYFKSLSWRALIVLLPFFFGLPLYFHYPWVILTILKCHKTIER
ncbi:MAG: hypothetical protein QM786_01340 [Breznakibacter sp.]